MVEGKIMVERRIKNMVEGKIWLKGRYGWKKDMVEGKIWLKEVERNIWLKRSCG